MFRLTGVKVGRVDVGGGSGKLTFFRRAWRIEVLPSRAEWTDLGGYRWSSTIAVSRAAHRPQVRELSVQPPDGKARLCDSPLFQHPKDAELLAIGFACRIAFGDDDLGGLPLPIHLAMERKAWRPYLTTMLDSDIRPMWTWSDGPDYVAVALRVLEAQEKGQNVYKEVMRRDRRILKAESARQQVYRARKLDLLEPGPKRGSWKPGPALREIGLPTAS